MIEACWISLVTVADDVGALFARAEDLRDPGGFYDTQGWYRLLCATARPDDATACFLLIRREGRAVALLALWRFGDGHFESLTAPYSCLYHPLIAGEVNDAVVRQIGQVVARQLRAAAYVRLDCLDADWPPMAAFCAGLRAGGLVLLRFDHFGNWHDQVSIDGYSGDWAFYLVSRDGALRQTIRRRRAKIARDGGFRWEMVRAGARLEAGIAAFEAVYARSWKEAEPYPAFNAEMMRLAAASDALRLALLWHGETPVAAQYWLVTGAVAQVLKLAHDPAFDAFSPGTVLTAWTIEALLDGEAVRALDFGRGDDAYKQLWVSHRRQRIGLIAANPRRLAGLVLILRHVAGGLRRVVSRK